MRSSQDRRRRRHARLLARLSGPARLKRVEAAVDRRCPGANLHFPRKGSVTYDERTHASRCCRCKRQVILCICCIFGYFRRRMLVVMFTYERGMERVVLCRYVAKDKRDETGAREEKNIHCQCATFTVRGQGKKGPESGKHLPPIPTLNTHTYICTFPFASKSFAR